MRRHHDAYETPPWQTRALLAHQPISGVVLEPCAGDGSIAKLLSGVSGVSRVWTNDINHECRADFHDDAAHEALYNNLGPVDWVVTNPPFKMPLCRDIVAQAVRHARVGVAMILRISFREPTAKVNPRGPFLMRHPISRLLTMPRHSYTGNGKNDSATTEWAIWLRLNAPGWDLPSIQSLYLADQGERGCAAATAEVVG